MAFVLATWLKRMVVGTIKVILKYFYKAGTVMNIFTFDHTLILTKTYILNNLNDLKVTMTRYTIQRTQGVLHIF